MNVIVFIITGKLKLVFKRKLAIFGISERIFRCKTMSLKNSQNDSIDPKTPQYPLGSGGISGQKWYWNDRKRRYDNRKNE
jgi:hypothetical protein